jgi:hypothetical protein
MSPSHHVFQYPCQRETGKNPCAIAADAFAGVPKLEAIAACCPKLRHHFLQVKWRKWRASHGFAQAPKSGLTT